MYTIAQYALSHSVNIILYAFEYQKLNALTLLQYSLYCSGVESKPQYFWCLLAL